MIRRLVYVCADPGVPVFGTKGCSVHVQEVIRAMRRQGVEVTLLAVRRGGTPPADLADLPVVDLPPRRGETPAEREAASREADAATADALAALGPIDGVYERYALWSCAGLEWARRRGLATALEVNAPLIEEQARYRTLVHVGDARAMSARAIGAADALVAVSRPVADWLDGFPGSRGRVAVVPNGVDIARFRPSSAGGPGFTVGFVGTLKPWHGVEHLVDAFRPLAATDPAARLLIVGDGPRREAIETRLARLGLIGAAQLTGPVPPAEVPAWLARMDVAVAPYPDLGDCYFSPMKLFEYMAAGLPVVASAVGQIPDVVQHDHTALLVPPGLPGALAEALLRIRHDPDLAARLGRAARARVETHHAWDSTARRLLDLMSPAREAAG